LKGEWDDSLQDRINCSCEYPVGTGKRELDGVNAGS
jgi:hypothetical protein